jgi:hypothetical protein
MRSVCRYRRAQQHDEENKMHWLSGDLLYVAEKRKEVSVVGIGGLSRIKKISSLGSIHLQLQPSQSSRVPGKPLLRASTHQCASLSGLPSCASPRIRARPSPESASPDPDCIRDSAQVPFRIASCAHSSLSGQHLVRPRIRARRLHLACARLRTRRVSLS